MLSPNVDEGHGAHVCLSRELPVAARQPGTALLAPSEFPAGNGRAVSSVTGQ